MSESALSSSEVPEGTRLEIYSLKSYIAAVTALRNHLFPFRTEKLSSVALMVLTYQLGE